MYDVTNLTNEVQYLFFKCGKECLLAGLDTLKGVRDSDITPVIEKMERRKIISLRQIKAPASKAEHASRKTKKAAKKPARSASSSSAAKPGKGKDEPHTTVKSQT